MPKKSAKRVYNKSTGRDYTYDKAYNKRTVDDRVARNKARAIVKKRLEARYGKAKASSMLKGKDVDHKRPLKSGGKTTKSNIRLMSASKNRARKTK